MTKKLNPAMSQIPPKRRRTVQLMAAKEMGQSGMIFDPSIELPAMRSGGDTDYLCAGCKGVLFEGFDRGQISGGTFKCPACGAISTMVVTA